MSKNLNWLILHFGALGNISQCISILPCNQTLASVLELDDLDDAVPAQHAPYNLERKPIFRLRAA